MIPRDATRDAQDLEVLIDTMMTHGIVHEKNGRNQKDLSTLSGIPEGRIAGPLAEGAGRGLFDYRVRALNLNTGGSERIWWLTAEGRRIGPEVQKARVVAGLLVGRTSGQPLS